MYKNFKRILDEKGLTPYKVSKDTGVATSTLSEWKKGTYQPKVTKLIALAEYLQVDLAELIKID